MFDRLDITVEVHDEPTTHTVRIEKLKQWIKSRGRHPHEEARKEELKRLFLVRMNDGYSSLTSVQERSC